MSGLDAEDLGMVGWLLVDDAGHLDHGGWSVDSRDRKLVCNCGDVLFECVDVAK
jgi:hypothetical protein